MHLLGLNWQLQPADGHTFNNGIRTGLPGNDDVATMPSGGKGEVTAAACPLEVTGKFRALASWFRFSNPNLGRYAKRKRKGGQKSLPFIGAPVKSCLLFLSVSCVWLDHLELAWCLVRTMCIPMLSAVTGMVQSYLKASQDLCRNNSHSSSWSGSSSSSRRKSCLIRRQRAAGSTCHQTGSLSQEERCSLPGEEAAWLGMKEKGSELLCFGGE